MNAAPTLDLFGLDLVDAAMPDALTALLAPGGQRTAAFVNAHCVNVAARDDDYARTLLAADLLLPDGAGVALAARLTGRRLAANLNGTDLFVPLCREAAERGLSVFLLGARPGVAERAAQRAQAEVPGLVVAGVEQGHFRPEEEEAVIERINASGADVLLVAFGVPLQEIWIERHRERLAPRIAIGVGAQFDFWSGRISRAPASWRRCGLEWAYRLALEPRRLFARYVLGNPLFVARALKHAALWHLARLEPAATSKRALDLAVAGTALAVLSPLFLLAALAIRMDSSGPVFFRQTRVGRDGKPFRIFKFRSMHTDAETRRAALLAESDRAGVCFKARHDPRVTRIGRWLRRFSLDELPQLLNVVVGDMSIVGPRPALPEEVAVYPARALGRLVVRPGLTGLWQVSGRADVDFDRMITMDVAYARSRSILLDLALMVLTFRAILGGRGAY